MMPEPLIGGMTVEEILAHASAEKANLKAWAGGAALWWVEMILALVSEVERLRKRTDTYEAGYERLGESLVKKDAEIKRLGGELVVWMKTVMGGEMLAAENKRLKALGWKQEQTIVDLRKELQELQKDMR